MKIGYDYQSVYSSDILELFKFAKNHKIKILHLRKKDELYYFYIPIYQRYKFKQFEYSYDYYGTIGLMKYILFLFKQYINIVGVICFFVSVMTCSYFIFDVQVKGTLPELNKKIVKTLKQEQVDNYQMLKNYEKLNEILSHLKTVYKDDVEYLNVYQKGSVFHVEYTKRYQEQRVKESYQNLYAKQDGMIAYFDVDSGLIKVKVNDYVKKGDLLVENTLISTQNETQIIPVKGHVYAYTFHQYTASIANKNQDQAEAFYQLLLMIREKLPASVLIDKENVLQMSKTRSKITLKMHYTLIEDIAVEGENNEGNR